MDANRSFSRYDGDNENQQNDEQLLKRVPIKTSLQTNSDLPPKPPSVSRARLENFIYNVDTTIGRGKLFIYVMIELILLIAIGTTGTLWFLNQSTAKKTVPTPSVSTNPVVGQASFFNSGASGTDNSTGICDEIQVTLHNLKSPTAGHSYYVWLLPDTENAEEGITTLLGSLTVSNGTASLTYANPQHNNLLLIGSRFLITEETSNSSPDVPSPDQHAWRYYAALPQTPNPQDPNKYSNLDHIRHLLAKDPTLQQLKIQGGLNTWFYANVQKILAWAITAKTGQQQDPNTLRRTLVDILYYLDGTQFVVGDLPQGAPAPDVDQQIARVPLLSAPDPANQNPPGYIHHIETHLQGLTDAPDATDAQRALAYKIDTELGKINTCLQQVQQDAKQLVGMSNTQLATPAAASLLTDLLGNANSAYVGQLDPTTDTRQGGAIWIHDVMSQVATLDVKPFTGM